MRSKYIESHNSVRSITNDLIGFPFKFFSKRNLFFVLHFYLVGIKIEREKGTNVEDGVERKLTILLSWQRVALEQRLDVRHYQSEGVGKIAWRRGYF